MVSLPVDEAYAFDYLAILYVKRGNGLDVAREIDEVEYRLRVQLWNFQEIVDSPEFLKLRRANADTFNAVAAAGPTPVQKANYRRFRAKKALQRKFWPTRSLSEKKRPGGV